MATLNLSADFPSPFMGEGKGEGDAPSPLNPPPIEGGGDQGKTAGVFRKIVKAPAKINIILRVLGRRANGYHDLFMLNERLDLFDEIEIRCRESDVGCRISDFRHQISVTCDDPSVPCDETNLCWKAAGLVAAELAPPGLGKASFAATNIHITKRIPVSAGLGGGSSDAAAALKGLNELLGLNLSKEVLAEIGVKLGADVPFFLHDGPAICEGIGDKITPLGKLPNMWILLINPNFPVSTKWVYEEFDKLHDLQLTEENQDVKGLARHFEGLNEVAKVVHNDLELVTSEKYPEIGHIKRLLRDGGALVSWMSGSGPTVVGMFDSEKSRDLAFEKLNRPGWRVIATGNC